MVDSNALRGKARCSALEGSEKGDGLTNFGSCRGWNEGDSGFDFDVDVDDATGCCSIRAVAGEGGVIGTFAGGAKGLDEGDLAISVGGLGGVGVADAVQVVPDLNRLSSDR